MSHESRTAAACPCFMRSGGAGEARRRITRLTPREVPGCGVDEQRERSRKRAHPPSHHPAPFQMSTGSVSIHTSATGHIDSRTTAEKRYQRHHIGRPCRSSTSNACRFTICAHPCAHRSCWHSISPRTSREVPSSPPCAGGISTGTRRRRARRDRRSPAARWSPSPGGSHRSRTPRGACAGGDDAPDGAGEHRAPSRPVRLETHGLRHGQNHRR